MVDGEIYYDGRLRMVKYVGKELLSQTQKNKVCMSKRINRCYFCLIMNIREVIYLFKKNILYMTLKS